MLSTSRPRNVELEREFTREAARGVCDPSALIQYAEARAGQRREYGQTTLVLGGRDLLQEARAELADGRNYLVWWLEDHVGDDQAPDVLIALRFLALAYDRLLEDG